MKLAVDQTDATVQHGQWLALKQELKQAAASMGIDDLGIASAEPFHEMRKRLLDHRNKGHESGFEEPDLDKRVEPSLHMENARSLIAIAVAYPTKLQHPPVSKKGAYRGIFSRSAWGEDYHHILRKRMEQLAEWLQERVEGVELVSMVDTGPLVDRAVAVRAGIGWNGKNCATISPTYGSWIYLGEMITNLPLPPDQPLDIDCGTCNKCIDACPTGALVGPGQLDAQRCISFLTQKKGSLSDEAKAKIGNRLYGCDTCQVVCPVNKGKNWTHHTDIEPQAEDVKPLLVPLLELSNKQFKRRFGYSAGAWRGKNPIQRNALIALGHFRDASAVTKMKAILLQDERSYMRETSAWALGRIANDEAVQALEEALEQETDPEVSEAIQRALGQ